MFLSSFSQERSARLPLSFDQALKDNPNAELAHVYVKGDEDAIRRFVNDNGGAYKYAFKNYHAICLPPLEVYNLDAQPFVDYIHFEHAEGQPLLSASLSHTNTLKVHQGQQGLPEGFTGEGVIIGVIDAGLELEHPDFQYSNGSTRVIELWDQTMAFNAQRTPSYGYGQIWDSASINAGNCPHQDQAQYYGHGTNTTGIAASNGLSNPDFTGHAPESELIIVSSNFEAIGWTNTVADAVDYIFSRAEALGKPCVINASLGTYLGSHDASDIPAQIIDEKITETSGRAMVCAAGNSGAGDPYHLGYEATTDTSFTWFELPANVNAGSGVIFFEVYGDTGDFETIQFAVGADQVSPSYTFRGNTSFINVMSCLNTVTEEDLYSTSGNYLGNVKCYSDSLNGVYRMQFLIQSIDSVQYNYRLMATGSGRLDLWSSEWLGLRDMVFDDLPSVSQFGDIAHYKLPDNLQSIVSSWACSDKVVTVGNYINRNTYIDVDEEQVTLPGSVPGALAFSSSQGPSRDQVLKPDVAAPGDNTLTAGAFFQLNNLMNGNNRDRVAVDSLHHRAGGTSSASPVVAGIGALFFEHCEHADWLDFREALHASARSDQFTNTTPNTFWGHGKADALGTLLHQTPSPEVQFLRSDFCDGEQVELTLNGIFPSVIWSNGDSAASTLVDETGQYFAEVENDLGCGSYSDSVNLFERSNPPVPSIVIDVDTPACYGTPVTLKLDGEFGAYTWSNGTHRSEIEIFTSGNYSCEVSNIFGCSSESDEVEVRFYPEMPIPELHLRVGDVLFLTIDTALAESYLWFKNNQALDNSTSPLLEDVGIGIYKSGYIDSNGCTYFAEEMTVSALGLSTMPSSERPYLYPNPFDDQLNIRSGDRFYAWRLYNLQGALMREGSDANGIDQIELGGGDLAPGSYFLELIGSQNTIYNSVVKQ